MILRGECDMKFKIDATMIEEEYFIFRKFATVHYGKKSRSTYRISACLIVFVLVWAIFKADGLTPPSIVTGVILTIWLIIWQIFYKSFCIWWTKKNVHKLKKNGKRLYSDWSVMEFYDDYFCDLTENFKHDVKYCAIESVSVIENKMIVLNADNGMAFMLPVRAFQTNEQYDAFIEFIKTKCPKIDFYDKI